MAEGRRLNSTGLLLYECMERGEQERVRVVFQVLARVKGVPRKADWGDVDAEEVVESVED